MSTSFEIAKMDINNGISQKTIAEKLPTSADSKDFAQLALRAIADQTEKTRSASYLSVDYRSPSVSDTLAAAARQGSILSDEFAMKSASVKSALTRSDMSDPDSQAILKAKTAELEETVVRTKLVTTTATSFHKSLNQLLKSQG
jgi:hypothetical protein